jgi:hypothetical protein
VTVNSDRLMRLRAELDQVEDEHIHVCAVLFAGGPGLTDEEYWQAVETQNECEDNYGRISAQIFRLENNLDAADQADLEKAEAALSELEHQRALLRDKYKTEQPAHIADFWK